MSLMIIAAWIIAGLLGILLAVQAIPIIGFARVLRRWQPAALEKTHCPRAAVVLCLRGRDRFLRDCLDGLFQQDYPDYEVHIVVDREDDPAWATVQEAISAHRSTKVHVEPLLDRHETCALKCSGILQAVGALEPGVQVVAMLDGDTVPHATWLRELVAPMEDPRIGVTSGNRWYMPEDPSWGSLVRYIWNAAAVVQMYWNRFTWGGSVALRSELARHPEMLERWRTAVSSDTVIHGVVDEQGYEAAFVPAVMMVNREQCGLGRFVRWLQRQMVVARLYHSGWLPVLIHGLGTSLVTAIAFGLLAAAVVTGQWQVGGVLAAAILIYLVAFVGLFASLEASVRHVVASRGEATAWLSPAVICKGIAALPLVQFLYAGTLIHVMFMRTVSWRGATYEISGPRRVRLIEDTSAEAPSHAGESIV